MIKKKIDKIVFMYIFSLDFEQEEIAEREAIACLR